MFFSSGGGNSSQASNKYSRVVLFGLTLVLVLALSMFNFALAAKGGGKCAPVTREDFLKALGSGRLLAKVDADGDGTLSETEFQKVTSRLDLNGSNRLENIEIKVFQLSENPKFMELFDKNSDGLVDAAEFSVIRAGIDTDRSGQCSALELARFFINFDDAMVGRYDSNGDGTVDPQEWDRAWKRRCGLIENPDKSCPFGNCECLKKSCLADKDFIKFYDRDGDGSISDAEWEDFVKVYRNSGSRIIKSVDANGNMKLDPEERLKFYRILNNLRK